MEERIMKHPILIVAIAAVLSACGTIEKRPDSDVRNDREMVAGYSAK